MTQEETLYQYYLKQTTKSRDEAINTLKKRDFQTLHRNYIHWFDTQEKNVSINSSKISDVIVELSKVTYQDNESEPIISTCVIEEEGVLGKGKESHIEICSYIYTIVLYDKCERLATHYAKSSLWKLNNQPTGKDAEACRKILKTT